MKPLTPPRQPRRNQLKLPRHPRARRPLLNAEAGDKPYWLNKALGWLLAGSGASVLCIGIGFIVQLSYQERLGYRLETTLAALDYLHLAGEFLVAAVVEPLTAVISDPPSAVFFLGLPATAFVFLLALSRLTRMRHVILTALATLYVVAICDFLFLDYSAILVDDALALGIERAYRFDKTTFLGQRSYDLWLLEVCSRLALTEQKASLTSLGITCLSPKKQNQIELRRHFVTNEVWALFLAAAGLLIYSLRQSDHSRSRPTMGLFTLAAFLPAMLHLSFLPYSYAKILKPTTADEAILVLKRSILADGPEAGAPTVEGNQGQQSSSFKRTAFEHGFILAQDSEFLVFYHKDERNLWLVPKREVELIKVELRSDVLEFHLKRAVELSSREVVEPI